VLSNDPRLRIPIEEVARQPLPGLAIPGDFAFSSDDRLLTYLFSPDRGLVRQLFAFELTTGHSYLLLSTEGTSEAKLTREEQLRRERQRQLSLGIASYAWAPRGERILIPLPGGLAIQNQPGGPLEELVAASDRPAVDPRYSPNGDLVAFVRDAELHVVQSTGGEPRQLTFGALDSGKTHGLAEFIAQEEMHRSEGYWWSPDSHLLAFEEVDETAIPIYRIVHQGKDAVGPSAQEDHHYPFAGAANARVRLGIVSVEGGGLVWLPVSDEEDFYLARVDWLADGRLVAQVENRSQTRLDLVAIDPATGERALLIREESDVWINLHDAFHSLSSDNPVAPGGFLWASERSGFRHLSVHGRDGRTVRTLTAGDWQVDSIAGVDEVGGMVYFLGTKDGPTESHLYSVPLSGGPTRRLTAEPGSHAVVLDHRREYFVDVHQGLDRPPWVSLRRLADGAIQAVLFDDPDPRVAALGLEPPELVQVTSDDGTTLHGALFQPSAEFGPGPFPTVVSVYGGPHAQMVTNSWRPTATLRAQYLRNQGYLVFVLDNRGSTRRGLAFEGSIKHNLGDLEVKDQVTGVRWLVAHGLTDPNRVGIYGWSYGGYMAAMCLCRAPDVFKVAVAGAPVTHWDGYDTHYTERYMGAPASDPEGYRASSILAHLENLRGKLLIVHGLIDENVHFRHSARLINALIRARKPYDLLLFPDERHLPRHVEDRIYLEERIRDFIIANL